MFDHFVWSVLVAPALVGIAARLLTAESDRTLVLRRFVGSLGAEDEQILRALLHDEPE